MDNSDMIKPLDTIDENDIKELHNSNKVKNIDNFFKERSNFNPIPPTDYVMYSAYIDYISKTGILKENCNIPLYRIVEILQYILISLKIHPYKYENNILYIFNKTKLVYSKQSLIDIYDSIPKEKINSASSSVQSYEIIPTLDHLQSLIYMHQHIHIQSLIQPYRIYYSKNVCVFKFMGYKYFEELNIQSIISQSNDSNQSDRYSIFTDKTLRLLNIPREIYNYKYLEKCTKNFLDESINDYNSINSKYEECIKILYNITNGKISLVDKFMDTIAMCILGQDFVKKLFDNYKSVLSIITTDNPTIISNFIKELLSTVPYINNIISTVENNSLYELSSKRSYTEYSSLSLTKKLHSKLESLEKDSSNILSDIMLSMICNISTDLSSNHYNEIKSALSSKTTKLYASADDIFNRIQYKNRLHMIFIITDDKYDKSDINESDVNLIRLPGKIDQAKSFKLSYYEKMFIIRAAICNFIKKCSGKSDKTTDIITVEPDKITTSDMLYSYLNDCFIIDRITNYESIVKTIDKDALAIITTTNGEKERTRVAKENKIVDLDYITKDDFISKFREVENNDDYSNSNIINDALNILHDKYHLRYIKRTSNIRNIEGKSVNQCRVIYGLKFDKGKYDNFINRLNKKKSDTLQKESEHDFISYIHNLIKEHMPKEIHGIYAKY